MSESVQNPSDVLYVSYTAEERPPITAGEVSSTGQYICIRCIGDRFLRKRVRQLNKRVTCSYCLQEAHGCELEKLAVWVEKAFVDHFERTPTFPDGFESSLASDSDSGYEWDRSGLEAAEAIAVEIGAESNIAEDIRSILAGRHHDVESDRMGEETEFARDSFYREKESDVGAFQQEWDLVEQTLKTEARYFSPIVRGVLDRVFGQLGNLRTRARKPVIVTAGPDADLRSVFRARVFQNEKSLIEAMKFPAKEVGPPPPGKAKAGRMNAAGVSVFYGSRTEKAAIAEVRPPVGSDVMVAEFELVQPIRLLDVAALKSIFVRRSVFDPAYSEKKQRVLFLAMVSQLLARPVMPDDELAGYLITQVIADYLANVANLDGVLFGSAQIGKMRANIALFQRSARVAPMDIPDGTVFSISTYVGTEDGCELAYSVRERVPATTLPPTNPVSQGAASPDGPLDLNQDPDLQSVDTRLPTVRLVPNNVRIHHIESAYYKVRSRQITRTRE